MDGIHDLGGMHGFGQVEREADEPVFHASWEARMFALAAAVPFAVPFGDDHFRRAMEHMDPADYLAASYYERWFAAVYALLRERGVIDDAEMQGGALKPLPPSLAAPKPVRADAVLPAIAAGASQARPEAANALHRFSVGDRVRTKPVLGDGHNRLPRYARGRVGTIVAERGAFIFADSHAATNEPNPQQLYTVQFRACDLWGDEAAPNDTLRLDLWDAYLDPAEAGA